MFDGEFELLNEVLPSKIHPRAFARVCLSSAPPIPSSGTSSPGRDPRHPRARAREMDGDGHHTPAHATERAITLCNSMRKLFGSAEASRASFAGSYPVSVPDAETRDKR